METAVVVAITLSAALFAHYGWSCLFSGGMVPEFERFGLARYRRLTGLLELLGAIGLLAGLFFPLLGALSAAGLTLLMVLGIAVRVRVGDPLFAMLPAFVLLVLNLFILESAIL